MAIKLEFKTCNNKKYKVEDICNNIVYVKESERYLLGLYYFIF